MTNSMMLIEPIQDKFPIVCLVHIPKTAGMSVRRFFFDLYQDMACHGHTTDDYALMSDDDVLRYRFFAGHTYCRDWSRLPTDTKFITILREPVERAISLYRYWNTIDIAHLESRPDENASILDAIKIARTQNIDDFILNDNGAIVEHLRGAYACQLVPDSMIDCCRQRGLPMIAAFDVAVRRLFSFDAVLTTEQLEFTFPKALARIGLIARDASLPRENVSKMNLDCDRQKLRRIMADVSPIDLHLYSVAQRLEAQLANQGCPLSASK